MTGATIPGVPSVLAGRRVNNPDQLSNAYIALHGIPHTQIDKVAAYFRPRIEARNRRNRLMAELEACHTAFPKHHVRLIGYDNMRQTQGSAMVIYRAA